ncbi:MAG: CehA/McbA family metallohydrolase [Litorilinea sp.]
MHYEFADTLTARDFKRHIPHSFQVPENCTGLSIRFHYAPPRVGDFRNMLTLTLFDSQGFRGAGHRHGDTHEVTLRSATGTAHASASPGYRPGALPAGEWTVQIDTHMILPNPDAGPECPYTLTVDAEVDTSLDIAVHDDESTGVPEDRDDAPRFDFVANSAPGWYRGDLHAHTFHSDAAWDVPDLAAAARALGLDFVTLTDHNTTTPLAQFAELTGPDLLTMGGMELTTFWGHAVCLGATEWVDWRVDAAGEAMNRIAEAQYAAGNLFVIAHPQSEGDPFCTGCRWVFPHMRPGCARYVEVWNGRWGNTDPRTQNEGSLGLWYDWLNQGLRLTATAGSDAHGPAHYGEGVGFNVIYAQSLSQAGILDGLRTGRTYLSAGATLEFSAQDGSGARAEIGEALPVAAHGSTDGDKAAITLRAAWADAPPGAELRLIRNGETIDARPVDARGATDWTLAVEPGQWVVLELRRADGWMWGLTNPIFFE